MKTFTSALFFSIVLLFTITAKAQTEDYVITTKGDTLKCSISTPLIGANKYTLPGANAKKFDRDEIKEYYITRKTLRKRAVFMGDKSKADYLTVVENGKICLYQIIYINYSQYGTTSNTEWYVGKGSDRVSPLKTSGLFLGKGRKERKDDFADMLKDKQDVYDKYIAEEKFSFNAIQNLVHLYNTGKSLKEDEEKQDKANAKKDDAYN